MASPQLSTCSPSSSLTLFEYACHEGNHSMEGILAGARADEKAAAQAATQGVAVRCGAAHSSSWSLKTISSSLNFFLIVTSPTSVMNSTSLSSSTMASSLGKR